MNNAKTPLRYLGFLILALTCIPRARIEVGAPLYLIDVLALLTLVSTLNRNELGIVGRARAIMWFVVGFAMCVTIGQANSYLTYGALKESVYVFGRYAMAVSLVWVTPKLINSADDLLFVVKMAVLGLTITSLITIGVSLPPTRGIVQGTVLSVKYLEPDAERATERTDYYSKEDKGTRGRSLIGTSTMTGGFLNLIWPLTFIAMNTHLVGRGFALWPRIACVFGAAGIVLTYGRGAILGLVLAGIAILFYGESNAKRNVALAGLILIMIIGSFGLESNLFYFDRVIKKTEVLLEADFSDDNEQGRLKSLTEPLNYLSEYPSSIVVGLGNTRGKKGGAVFNYHNTPAAAYHFFGLLGAFAHTGLFFLAMNISFSGSRKRYQSAFTTGCYRGLAIVFVAFIPWWLLGHATASVPRGVMLYFFMLGLVCAVEKMAYLERLKAEQDEEILIDEELDHAVYQDGYEYA